MVNRPGMLSPGPWKVLDDEFEPYITQAGQAAWRVAAVDGRPVALAWRHDDAVLIMNLAGSEGAVSPGELAGAEPCERCYVRRCHHDVVLDHDFEGIFVYTCRGCPPDVVWSADNMDEHPSHDHDFDWIPAGMDDRERRVGVSSRALTQQIGDYVDSLVKNYAESLFPPDGTSKDAIAAAALRRLLPVVADGIRKGAWRAQEKDE